MQRNRLHMAISLCSLCVLLGRCCLNFNLFWSRLRNFGAHFSPILRCWPRCRPKRRMLAILGAEITNSARFSPTFLRSCRRSVKKQPKSKNEQPSFTFAMIFYLGRSVWSLFGTVFAPVLAHLGAMWSYVASS
jgi:hypothetical protein